MAMTSHRRSQIMERQQQVAELHKKGWSQAAIADRLKVTQPTVSSDLKKIRAEWLRSTVRDFDLARAQELQKIELIEREAHAGWDRSQKPAQSAVIEGEGNQQPSQKPSATSRAIPGSSTCS
jgi:transcriptional regulator with XRE-family HTH domain